MQKILENRDECTGCSACAQSCAGQCISMMPDDEGFLFPQIDSLRCTDCGLCQRACPVLRTHKDPNRQDMEASSWIKPRVYAAWSLDETVRLNSSSGGIFSALADVRITNGGAVFGAAFDENFMVRHVGITDSSGLDDLRRSKYVQSDIQNTYSEAQKSLKEGKPVLFAGTGCQIAGLKSFLGKDYPDLLTIDLVCYGVPSPGIWSLYLKDIKRRYKSDIRMVSFRNKQNGWAKYRMKIEFENGRVYSRPAVDETYFIGFGKGLFNRRSCSSCMFRHPNSKADITLADFWGIDKLPDKDMSDNKGVSQLIINTPKGQEALDGIAVGCRLRERPFEEAAGGNPRLVSSCPMPKARAQFYGDLAKGISFPMIRRKYMNPSIQRIKRMIKSLIGRA